MKLHRSRSTVTKGKNDTYTRSCVSYIKGMMLFLLIIFLYVGSQAQTITHNKKRMSDEKVITAIQEQSGYNLLYASDILQEGKKVDISFDKLSITQARDAAISNQPFVYELIGKTIVIKSRVENKTNKSLSNMGTDGKEEPMINRGWRNCNRHQTRGKIRSE